MDSLFFVSALLLVARLFYGLSVNAKDELLPLDIIIVQDISDKFSYEDMKHVFELAENLCKRVKQGGPTVQLKVMVGPGLVKVPSNKSVCNMKNENWNQSFLDLKEKWRLHNTLVTTNSKKPVNVIPYPFVFNYERLEFQRRTNADVEKVLILITHNSEKCKVDECLTNSSRCCAGCHDCNTSRCDMLLLDTHDDMRFWVKLFVTNEAEDLKRSGVWVTTIGISNNTEPARLRCWASPSFYLHLDSYKDLPHLQFRVLVDQSTTLSPRSIGCTTSGLSRSTGVMSLGTMSDSTSASLKTTSLGTAASRSRVATALPWWYMMAFAGFAILVILLLIVIAVIALRQRKSGASSHEKRPNEMIEMMSASEGPTIESQGKKLYGLPPALRAHKGAQDSTSLVIGSLPNDSSMLQLTNPRLTPATPVTGRQGEPMEEAKQYPRPPATKQVPEGGWKTPKHPPLAGKFAHRKSPPTEHFGNDILKPWTNKDPVTAANSEVEKQTIAASVLEL